MSDTRRVVDAVVVGGGPAGSAVATRLARAGAEVVLLERSPAWRWRACGVFASPAVPAALERLGMDPQSITELARPISAMRLETPGGAVVRLTYGADAGGPTAVAVDRARLDPALLDMAAAAGVTIKRGVTVRVVRPRGEGRGRYGVVHGLGRDGPVTVRARVIVGADGPNSVVAMAAGVARPVRLGRRIGLSWHLADRRGDGLLDARMLLVPDGYVGVAPVPGGRVNVGVVLGPSWRAALERDGAARTSDRVLAGLRRAADDDLDWRAGPPCDHIAGSVPLGSRVTRRAGRGWLLVGDAAGFLDPFTGEGLHRALVSAALAAPAALVAARADSPAAARRAEGAYDRSMRRRFAAKDAVSWLVQVFVGHPALMEYAARRLATRTEVRATMGLVMGDLVPASRGLDPRFLAAVLAP